MNVLIHICCAACLLAVLEPLQRQGHRLRGFFRNPNIHPLIEFRRRLKAVKVLNETLCLPMDYDEAYALEAFLGRVVGQGAGRCAACYRERLGAAAQHAREVGCAAFTTTLLASSHQDLSAVRRAGAEAAAEAGVSFLDGDWRDRAAAAHENARRRHLYLQSYCGCIYSEYERYRDTRLHVYRGSGEAEPTGRSRQGPGAPRVQGGTA
jgi:predicted adenine nucleotide alpha hydrolase (AANH) superfamily ATPase